MAENEITSDDDDFEKLLQSFINSKLDDENDISNETGATKTDAAKTISSEKSPADDNSEPNMSEEERLANEDASREFEDELTSAFADARSAVEEAENIPELRAEESELAQAFINYQNSVNIVANANGFSMPDWRFVIDALYPNYKPSTGIILSGDLVDGWLLLCKIFPDTIGKFPVNSTDEEFLNFAETIKDQNLQLAVISYVEILIDMESCELSYQTKLIQYQEKHIKRIMYEEYLARKERQERFVEAVKKKNFPIDAEKLISSYFRVAQKDVDGAYKALTTNPAIFAPIDFSKIKPRFFGLVKVTPKDGIRVNIEIGKYMKKIKI